MSARVLSVYYYRNRLGASCYDQETSTVYVLNDLSEDDDDFRMLRSLLLQMEPSIVIASRTQDVNLLTELNKCCSDATESADPLEGAERKPEEKQHDVEEGNGESPGNDEERGQRNDGDDDDDDENDDAEDDDDNDNGTNRIIALHLMPSVAYNFEDAKKRIATLFESPRSDTKQETNLRLAFRVDLTATNMVCAFGALLKYLDAVRLGVEFEDINTKTPITTIKTITLEKIVEIDENSRCALQIFQDALHPSAFKAYTAGGAREGISLFRMCNRCLSKSGESLLRRWFERPTTNQEILKNRATAIRYFVQDCNLDALDFIRIRLKKICTLKGILRRAKSQRLSLNDWRNIYTTCNAAQQIVEYIRMRKIKLALIDDELKSIGQDIARITAVIFEIINFSESFAENRFVVNAKVDENLDRLKELYASLPKALTHVAKAEATILNVPSSVCYVPMFGYLLVVPRDTVFPPDIRNKIELLYQTDDALHLKNDRMRQLDREIGDIKMEIIDVETNAMLKLKQLICHHDKTIQRAANVCATLDCIISLALTAREYDWHCPNYVDEAVIDVDAGRHAIAEVLSTNKFVPNFIRSGGEQSKVKILIGPNASGKSVYLKQVGLIVFLAHIGSFVPATSAIIGPVDRIITRIHTIDCVLDGMSTFATDLSRMAIALRRGSGNSLILIDEFGKGTLMEAGLSLLTASLNHWIRKGKEDCPHVFAVSHFYSITDHIEKDPNLLSFLTLEVTLDNNGKCNFRYELIDGFIDCSYATHIASKFGIDDEIVKRADEIFGCLKHNQPIDPVDDELELLFKMAPLLENLRNANFETDLKGFLQKMSKLLLPMVLQSTAASDESSSNQNDGGDVNIESNDDDNDDNNDNTSVGQVDLTRSDNTTVIRHSESNMSKILHEMGESAALSSTDMQNGKDSNLTSKTLDSTLNFTIKSSILKKTQFEHSSRSSHNVSFVSPLADLQNFRFTSREVREKKSNNA